MLRSSEESLSREFPWRLLGKTVVYVFMATEISSAFWLCWWLFTRKPEQIGGFGPWLTIGLIVDAVRLTSRKV